MPKNTWNGCCGLQLSPEPYLRAIRRETRKKIAKDLKRLEELGTGVMADLTIPENIKEMVRREIENQRKLLKAFEA